MYYAQGSGVGQKYIYCVLLLNLCAFSEATDVLTLVRYPLMATEPPSSVISRRRLPCFHHQALGLKPGAGLAEYHGGRRAFRVSVRNKCELEVHDARRPRTARIRAAHDTYPSVAHGVCQTSRVKGVVVARDITRVGRDSRPRAACRASAPCAFARGVPCTVKSRAERTLRVFVLEPRACGVPRSVGCPPGRGLVNQAVRANLSVAGYRRRCPRVSARE